MAFDISLEESKPPAPIGATFDEFHSGYADQVGRALWLACGDARIADDATVTALTSASQRWKYLMRHTNPVGWTVEAGLQHVDKVLLGAAPTSVNRATGGYVRGLQLAAAIDALPLQQRAALVAGYYLGWSDDFTAHGFEMPVTALSTRRKRGVSFVGHHLHQDGSQVEPLLRSYFEDVGAQYSPTVPDASALRSSGRRRTARHRLAAIAVAVFVIVAGGWLLRPTPDELVVDAPQSVDGPRTSQSWFDPVSDGNGSFVALNTSGSAKFVGSSDGIEWFEAAIWNSRGVDLRTEVTGFARTGGRYVASIESLGGLGQFLAPHIATSQNLWDWNVRQLPLEAPTSVDGLRRGYQVVANAAAHNLVLVALEATEQFDPLFFDVRADDVCGEEVNETNRRYFLCESESTIDVSLGDDVSGPDFFLAADGEPFRRVELPPDAAPRSLVGFGGGFAVVDATQGQVWVSPNGVDWERATTAASPNRFVLLEGDERGALVIEPDETGWTSHVVVPSGLGVSGDIPLVVAPSGVWSQPDVASGPAGWALFVTTSRPWERAGEISGWAVATPSWIVSKLPDADTITAQSVPAGTTLRLAVDGPWVTTEVDGTIELRDPHDNRPVVRVTQEQIEQALPTALDEARVKAHVFFSADGVSWTSVWSSIDDTWSGSVAVGDDEILLSGTELTGSPIAIPLGDS